MFCSFFFKFLFSTSCLCTIYNRLSIQQYNLHIWSYHYTLFSLIHVCIYQNVLLLNHMSVFCVCRYTLENLKFGKIDISRYTDVATKWVNIVHFIHNYRDLPNNIITMEQTRKWNAKSMFQKRIGWKTICIWLSTFLEISLYRHFWKFNDGAWNFNNGVRDLIMMEYYNL